MSITYKEYKTRHNDLVEAATEFLTAIKENLEPTEDSIQKTKNTIDILTVLLNTPIDKDTAEKENTKR